METFVVVVILLLVVGFVVYQRLGKGTTRQRKPPPIREPTVDSLQPGDLVSLADGRDLVVEAVLDCGEKVGGRSTRWRWSFLSDGLVLEAAPDGNVLYDRVEVLHQGEEGFQRLVEEGGVLKSFEQQVREGTVAEQPVVFRHGRHSYRVRSTGTFAARLIGPPPQGEVWRDLSARPEDNVYFELEGREDEPALGVWTTHIALLFGRPLASADIRALYPGPSQD